MADKEGLREKEEEVANAMREKDYTLEELRIVP
jgi:hypothetical protein